MNTGDRMQLDEGCKKDLLSMLNQYYHYDFSGYAGASLERRIRRFAGMHGMETFFDLKHYLLNSSSLFEKFVMEITVNVTEMYRDPSFFCALTQKVFPTLETYPFRKVWHAGCSSGEEVYSLAILLKEAGLLEKTEVVGSDINREVLASAAEGLYKPHPFHAYREQYTKAGGRYSLNDYFTATPEGRIRVNGIQPYNLLFKVHNLAGDEVIPGCNLILCRNVLIYFNRSLQDHVLGLFYRSLRMLGYLALGSKETIFMSQWADRFEVVDRKEKIYRKIA